MFDLRTEIREPGTGKIARTQHYVRHVSRDCGEWYERDGKCYDATGKEIEDPRPVARRPVAAAKVDAKPEVKKAETIGKLT